ncbi:HD domain-containing phosphohydrolase [Saccharophagus degradans]|uniref:Response regulator receiver n=1 Tax=Saccharophagus degradans (strain 2-40 / ATCC 43961 / DSM 17024) TaxID=203122 RepID=Q21E19_SACD2|nr:HD domain-containing phosphohydrolase [Saccharophagus degradans]ABD83060.1 response regulator receiver [Saccharophagus degradans 2-40]
MAKQAMAPNDCSSVTLLFVDDELPILKAFKRLVRGKNWTVYCAESAQQGIQILSQNNVDIVVSDMRMPNMNGAQFLSYVRDNHPQAQRILITGYSDLQSLQSAINEAKISNYISKPWEDEALLDVLQKTVDIQEGEKERRRLELVKKSQNKKLGRLALSLNSQVNEKSMEVNQALTLLEMERNHAQMRVHELTHAVLKLLGLSGKGRSYGAFIAESATAVGRAIGLSALELENLYIAAALHNIGYLVLGEREMIEDANEQENEHSEQYKAQVAISEEILNGMPALAPVASIIATHKERLNGTGFPNKLKAEQIPMPARILGVVSDYVQLHRGRMCSGVEGHAMARKYIESRIAWHYDIAVVKHFFEQVDDAALNYISTILASEVHELQPGMILANDIRTHNKVLLLPAGVKLNQNQINKIELYERFAKTKLIVNIVNTS